MVRPKGPPELIAAALRLLRHPGQLPAARGLLRHPDAHVRSEAIAAVARLGDAADIRALAQLLEDAQWKVRFGAAQALAASPLLRAGELEALRAAAASREAIGVLSHAMAERGLS
jgi:HEAT repeat protein